MVTKSLYERAQAAHDAIDEAKKELTAIQLLCTHPKEMLKIEPRCGGEFDNHYTNHMTCGVCANFWTEDQ